MFTQNPSGIPASTTPINPGLVPIIGMGGQILSDYMQNQANMKLAKYSYSKDLEMWHRQNAYNDPSQQMARLKKAGLNPNLVYGSGSVTGNTSSQLPKYNTPGARYSNYIARTLDVLSAFSNVQQTEAMTQNIQAKTATEAFNTSLRQAMAESLGYDVQYKSETLQDRIRQMRSRSSQSGYESKWWKEKLRLGKLDQTFSDDWTRKLGGKAANWLEDYLFGNGESLFNFNK